MCGDGRKISLISRGMVIIGWMSFTGFEEALYNDRGLLDSNYQGWAWEHPKE